jgi:phosphohistidine phosphatase
MLIYLVQHGHAKSAGEDPERHLSKKGLKEVQKVAAFLAGAKVEVARIFHSEKKRTLETAEILANSIKPGREVNEAGGLKALDDPKLWYDRISNSEEDTMLVGHLPHLTKLASMLLSGDAEKNPVDFKLGGVVCLKKAEDGEWSVEWMLVPDLIPEE